MQRLREMIIPGLLIVLFGGSAPLMATEPEEVELWAKVDLADGAFEGGVATPGEPMGFDFVQTVMRPTLFTLPVAGLGDAVTVEAGALDGEASIHVFVEGAWQPFDGGLEVGEGEEVLLAVIPQGQASVFFSVNLQAACERNWLCTFMPPAQPLYLGFQYCAYKCIFQFDDPVGCSGLTPNVTVSGKGDNVQFWSCKPSYTFKD